MTTRPPGKVLDARFFYLRDQQALLNNLRDVLLSSTVKDLVAGSGIQFTDLGVKALKGIPDEWRLFRVDS